MFDHRRPFHCGVRSFPHRMTGSASRLSPPRARRARRARTPRAALCATDLASDAAASRRVTAVPFTFFPLDEPFVPSTEAPHVHFARPPPQLGLVEVPRVARFDQRALASAFLPQHIRERLRRPDARALGRRARAPACGSGPPRPEARESVRPRGQRRRLASAAPRARARTAARRSLTRRASPLARRRRAPRRLSRRRPRRRRGVFDLALDRFDALRQRLLLALQIRDRARQRSRVEASGRSRISSSGARSRAARRSYFCARRPARRAETRAAELPRPSRGAAHLHGDPRDVRDVVRDVRARRALLAVVHDPPHRARERVAGAARADARRGRVGSGKPARARPRRRARGYLTTARTPRGGARTRAGCPRPHPGCTHAARRTARARGTRPGDATRGRRCRVRNPTRRSGEARTGARAGGNHARHVLAGHHGALSRTAAVGPRGREGTRRVG